ncbi:MAG: radical SAM protein [Desulfurococcales archaeon]|nr:radical SAM protein [Desulfurococcales archaeon]
MPRPRSMLILDGYNDEPGGLGVPPYIDVYPRYIAGAAWSVDKTIRIDYVTVDQFRADKGWLKRAHSYDVVVFIAGVVVPGRYIGARPMEPQELMEWSRVIRGPLKVLVGPAARWGMMGPRGPVGARELRRSGVDVLLLGDPEEYFTDLFAHGEEKADPYRVRTSYKLVDKVAPLGARVIRQHPNHGRNLMVELETYRGCTRWVSGGCSFCVEPLRGRPIQRSPQAIVAEVEALYRAGARNFRLGRQADILVYGSPGLGAEEWPRPDPGALRRLLTGIRSVAPGLVTLHIDNVNPGTIARHPKASVEALKAIVELHTPGDVAAMGLETADDRVSRINNLNTTAEEALTAIEVVNKVGAHRGGNGLPHLLPGINFILGLPGETRETYRLNKGFLEEVLARGLLVRRVNVRRILPLPTTRASRMKPGVKGRNEPLARSFTHWVRNVFDKEMLRRITPPGTILKGLWVEECTGGKCYARQPGSYPLMNVIPCTLPPGSYIPSVRVTGVHSGRSIESKPPRCGSAR